jgi:hypothetical protein
MAKPREILRALLALLHLTCHVRLRLAAEPEQGGIDSKLHSHPWTGTSIKHVLPIQDISFLVSTWLSCVSRICDCLYYAEIILYNLDRLGEMII